MTLIDRYLNAVRGYLPAGRQDDILRELSDDLHAQVSDREEDLGRALSEDEQAAMVKALGHPMALAARYQPQRHVIGSLMFPVYWQTLKIALGVALTVRVAMGIASVMGGGPAASAIGPIATFPFGAAVVVFGWVTLIFALIDAALPRILDRCAWSPTKLPAGRLAIAGPRGTLLAEIVGSTIFLLWWLALPQFPFLVLGPMAAFLSLAPVWHQMYLPTAAIWLLSLATLWAMLLRPDWVRLREAGRLLTDALALVIAAVLLRADAVQIASGIAPTPDLLNAVGLLNTAIHIGAVVTVLATAWQVGTRVSRLRQSGTAAA